MGLLHMVSNVTTAAPATKPPGEAFEVLLPTIVQCFTIIFLGYITGRAGLINGAKAQGIGVFTSMFALPALLFSNMATLDWSQVEWKFLGAIFLSKASFFIVTLLFTLIVRGQAAIGLAALAGIFVTQSNDFALGYPIVQAIYGEKQPQFLQYIYLIAPISLVIINPIGFILLELQKARKQSDITRSYQLLLKVVREVCTNPIIFMTVAGVIANVIFSHSLPKIISNLLATLGNAYSACVLFILGFNIVGKFTKSMNSALLGSGLLIFGKLLAFPLLTMGVTRALKCGASTNSTTDYYMFAFLYGTFPSAVSVSLYASRYEIEVDLISTALVLCTFLSAPLMFMSAMLFSMQVFSMDYQAVLRETASDISILSLVCCLAVLVLFLATKRATRMPHVLVLFIALAQLLWSIGVIIDSYVPVSHTDVLQWWEYVKFSLVLAGQLSVSCMSAMLAATMYIISCNSLCRALILRPWCLGYGMGVPLLCVSIVLIFGSTWVTPKHGEIMFGKTQLAITLAVLGSNVLATVILLILRHRWSSLQEREKVEIASDSADGSMSEEAPCLTGGRGRGYGSCRSAVSSSLSDLSECEVSVKLNTSKKIDPEDNKQIFPHVPSIEDIIPYPSSSQSLASVHDGRMCSLAKDCTLDQQQKCKTLLRKYDRINTLSECEVALVKDTHRKYQFGRMTVLLLLLLVSQVTSIFFELWRLLYPEVADVNNGGYVEIEFIHAVLNSGQGFFTFAVFGLDVEVIFSPIINKLKRILKSINRSSTSNTS